LSPSVVEFEAQHVAQPFHRRAQGLGFAFGLAFRASLGFAFRLAFRFAGGLLRLTLHVHVDLPAIPEPDPDVELGVTTPLPVAAFGRSLSV
jgi:hypothetical protein